MKYVLLVALLFIGPAPYRAAAVDLPTDHQLAARLLGVGQLTYLLEQFSPVTVRGHAQPAHLVFSYSDSKRSYTYDQALAALAFTWAGHRREAELILNALSNLQSPVGSWKFSYEPGQKLLSVDAETGPISGAIAWVVMAMNAYRLQYGLGTYDVAAERALDYLAGQRVAVEWGDTHTHPIRFSPQRPSVVSVEHNLDAYSAFLNSKLPRHQQIAPDLRKYVESMWDTTHFHAGFDLDAKAPNRSELYLDTQSWGVLALGAYYSGLETSCDHFFKTDPVAGFFDYHPANRELASTSDHPVWTEGSFGMLLAMEAAQMPECRGKTRAQILAGLETLTNTKGGVPYATPSSNRDFSQSPSIAGTAWLYFLKVGFNPFKP